MKNLLVSILLAIIIIQTNALLQWNRILSMQQCYKQQSNNCVNGWRDGPNYEDQSTVYNRHWSNPTCVPGRHTIVHLFEWKWSDIAEECERFLGPYGYCGVQISPPNENRVLTKPERPWWERYQPVSYELFTRSGNEVQFVDMVKRCNNKNVRIYVDAVINHMTQPCRDETGSNGSQFEFIWNGDIKYPAVPFETLDFNGKNECPTEDLNITNYGNTKEVRNCRLNGLADLNQKRNNVKNIIAKYMNHLISLGVAGFRVDAAKHMWPDDLQDIYRKLHSLNSTYFPGSPRPFIFQEVIDMGNEVIKASEYTGFARVTNFLFGFELGKVFRRQNPAKYLWNWGEAWNMPKSGDVVVFIDNHDNQRGHGGGGGVLTHKDSTSKIYKMATAFMLAHPYGFPRVMSSFRFESPNDGPPHYSDMSIKSVKWGSDLSCGSDWVCEHRWRQIYNMVAFRNVVSGTNRENWWDDGDYQIAFSRGNKGFIAINAGALDMRKSLQTGLSPGTYCDVISGDYKHGRCTGLEVNVHSDGTAYFNIESSSDDSMVAIHLGAKKDYY